MTPPRKSATHTANQVYTAQQAQAVLGIKHDKFYNLVNSGQLETFKNGRRYVTAEAITRYQQEQMRLERERLQAKRARVPTRSNPMGSNSMGNANPQPAGRTQPSQ